MKFYSTNKQSEKVNLKQAMLMGLAPDNGLFMPENIPRLRTEKIISFRNKNYNQIAFEIMNCFFKNEVSVETLKKIIHDSYYFFVPFERVSNNIYIMRLDQGPTASFKDFGARMMARLMNRFLEKQNKKLLILVATSGDTGGAVADAFYGQHNISVIVLFPKKEVSVRQRKQMTTLGKNIKAVAVKGKFDDCQTMVKHAFRDPDLNNLSSANSINFGRLIPQAVYYFYAFSRMNRRKIIFSVPSGNFGNLMGGIIAKKMGLPVKKFIVAVNKNDEFVRFINSGKYEPIIPSKKCLSSAMNVGHPSNLARLIDVYGGHIDEKGVIHKMPDMEEINNDMFAVSVNDKETVETIKQVYSKYKVILEPHGAVAWKGVQEYLKKYPDEKTPIISLETADPAKFPKELNKLGIYPELPESMTELDNRKEVDKLEISKDFKELKRIIKHNF